MHLQRHDPSLASQQHNMLIVVSGGEVLLLLSWTLELLINELFFFIGALPENEPWPLLCAGFHPKV